MEVCERPQVVTVQYKFTTVSEDEAGRHADETAVFGCIRRV